MGMVEDRIRRVPRSSETFVPVSETNPTNAWTEANQ